MSEVILNRTPVDNLGEKVGLYREKSESISEFQERVYTALKSLSMDKYSFRDSLDYLTATRSVDLFIIKPPANSFPTLKWDGIFLTIGNNDPIHISEIKFATDLKDKLIQFSCEYLGDEDELKYLKTSNILPFDTNRTRLNKTKDRSKKSKLNELNIQGVYDRQGLFKESGGNPSSPSTSDNLEEWKVEGNILHTENNEADIISYNYSDYPLIVRWSEFKYYTLNNDSFDYRIKSLEMVKPNSTEEPYILTQEGAKLINSLYKTSNTYWGK